MARRRGMFARARRAVRTVYARASSGVRRSHRRRGHARPALGLIGKAGALVAAVPLGIAAIGNGADLPGALGIWRKGGNLEDVASSFLDGLLVQYVGVTRSGAKWTAGAEYSGWKFMGYGVAMMLGDALAGKLARRMGVRAPKLPLVGRPLSG